ITTPEPGTTTPLIPAIKVLVCVPSVPIRTVPASSATPSLPISILSSPVVRRSPAANPNAMLLKPVVLLLSASAPMAVLTPPVVFSKSAKNPVAVFSAPLSLKTSASVPTATFCEPTVLSNNAAAPTAALESPVLRESAPPPTPVLKLESVLEKRERQPIAVFPVPMVLLLSARSPRKALKRLESQPWLQIACAPGKNAKQARASGISKPSRQGTRCIECFNGRIFICAKFCLFWTPLGKDKMRRLALASLQCFPANSPPWRQK